MPGPGSPPAQPSDHAGWCACPILAAHAEMQRLSGLGLEITYSHTVAYIIAALREKHGCRRGQKGGPGWCYWYDAVSAASGNLVPDYSSVPELRRRREPGKDTGEYL